MFFLIRKTPFPFPFYLWFDLLESVCYIIVWPVDVVSVLDVGLWNKKRFEAFNIEIILLHIITSLPLQGLQPYPYKPMGLDVVAD